MKVSIRQGVFETNSSSVHSCSITTEKNYKGFNEGKIYFRQQWNDVDEYLPKDEAILRNIEFFKKNIDDLSEDDWKKFEDAYKKTGALYSAFEAVGLDWDDIKYDFDSDDYFMSEDEYWSYHEYEDWSHSFKDSNGTKMVAWGYVGHD